MANQSILAAFERLWQHTVAMLGNKSDVSHNHDEEYYTKFEIDDETSAIWDETNTLKSSINELNELWESQIDGEYTISVGETIELACLAEDAKWGTPIVSGGTYDCGNNPNIIGVTSCDGSSQYAEGEAWAITGVSGGTTIFAYTYTYDSEQGTSKQRTLKYKITVTETWTFTLEDGTEVTKAVYVG